MTVAPPSASALMSRWAAVGSVAAFIAGAIVGLIVGLDAYPPTAWFAVFEVGIPAAVVGGLLGLVGGAVAYTIQRLRRTRSRG
jgi:uncharacterized membrane protein YedE/YeeE